MFKRTGGKSRPRVSNPKADFALRFEMITQDEYEAILSGQMSLEGKFLMNLNVKHSHLKTGEKHEIYPERAFYILADRLGRS
jgi:hypothetical protein